MNEPVKIGIVAGEASGDMLGADLIRHLRSHFPEAQFSGLGGDAMLAEGFTSLFDMDRLSIMGFVEPLKRLPELLRMRKALVAHFLASDADLVVGIDSPDFNLGLELRLRKRGLLTAHYVSPSVWAWRQGRIKTIARAVDRMIALFPFESDFYRRHQVPATFVGHPLADRIPMVIDTERARRELGLNDAMLLAVMPGSRGSEIRYMGDLFLQACVRLHRENPSLRFVMPSASEPRHRELSELLAKYPELPITLVRGKSHQVMAASDAVLLTSGTTALEAMLFKKPMVVAYRMGGLGFWLLARLVKTAYISLPNLIAGKPLVPELIQDEANVDNLVLAVGSMLYDEEKREMLKASFSELHRSLKLDAGASAAVELAAMIRKRRGERV